MMQTMTDLNTLISVVNAHAASENNVRFSGKDRIKVEEKKREVTVLDQRVEVYWHYGVPNDFCVFIEVLDPRAAYVYVRLEDENLSRTLVISDGMDYFERRELSPLERSLDDNQIARQLVEAVVTSTAA